MSSASPQAPKSPKEWKAALDSLPATPDSIPAFFFGHGSPMLQWPDTLSHPPGMTSFFKQQGPHGPLANFLAEFGPVILDKYKPKGIVVFSAHWETSGERQVTDYGDPQPLLMDYFGFDDELYQLKFVSKGSHELSQHVIEVFKEAGMLARLSKETEARGRDGRGYMGPGLDHGVFVPFRIMFGTEFRDIPIVEASMDASMSPEKNWAIGRAVSKLRKEGYLILSGGLTYHNLGDFTGFSESTAQPVHKEFHQAILDAVIQPKDKRKEAMFNLTKHKGFRPSQPREDHFVPLYVAAGAGEEGDVKVLCGLYSSPTFAFGL